MTIASALPRAIDQAAGQRRAVTGSRVLFSRVAMKGAYAPPHLGCWSHSGTNPEMLAPYRRMPAP